MNIQEAIEQINKMLKIEKDCLHYDVCKQDIEAIETLLTAYEKEKAKVERIKDKLTHLKILAKIENEDIDRIKELEILLKEE